MLVSSLLKTHFGDLPLHGLVTASREDGVAAAATVGLTDPCWAAAADGSTAAPATGSPGIAGTVNIVAVLSRVQPQKSVSELAARVKAWWIMAAVFFGALTVSDRISLRLDGDEGLLEAARGGA